MVELVIFIRPNGLIQDITRPMFQAHSIFIGKKCPGPIVSPTAANQER